MDINQYWAKTSPYQSVLTHGKVSGYVAQVLFDQYLSVGSKRVLCSFLSLTDTELKAFVGYLVSMHDVGKIEYNFQSKDPSVKSELDNDPTNADKLYHQSIRHEKTGNSFAKEVWKEIGENSRAGDLFSKVIGAHHPGKTGENGFPLEGIYWFGEQAHYEQMMRKEFLNGRTLVLPTIDASCKGAVGATFLSIMILADWIASGPAFSNAEAWVQLSDFHERIVKTALDFLEKSGLKPNPYSWPDTFCKVWPSIPVQGRRPLQREIEDLFSEDSDYSLLLIEAPMGEGKTEAGVYAALQMMQYHKKDGFYIALPTAATSNQMVGRMRKLLDYHDLDSNVRLLHSMAWLERMGELQKKAEHEEESIVNWLAPVKRGLLGQYAVGTIDQAMMAATTVKFGALRLLGLSNKVLVIDEIHSYDAYMSEIIKRLLEWCKCLEIPVVMLSATLPPKKKEELFSPYTNRKLSEKYPLITAIHKDGSVLEHVITATSHKLNIKTTMLPILNDTEQIAMAAIQAVEDGGCLCVLMNTVKEAQSVFLSIKEKYDDHLMLFHGQFPAKRRAEIESDCVQFYGSDKTCRPRKSILVATQVVEQSLDVDFDGMISAIAPVDLLFQRMGRVHRHSQTERPDKFKEASFYVLVPGKEESFGLSSYVYPECILRSSCRVFQGKTVVRIPEDIATMVQDGYDPQLVPHEDMKQWLENQIREQVEAGTSQRFLINEPYKQYNALIEDAIFDDNGPVASALTRLGEPSVRIALLEKDQFKDLEASMIQTDGQNYVDVLDKGMAERVMMQSVSMRRNRFDRDLSNMHFAKGGKLISGTWIAYTEDGICKLDNGKSLCNDLELGVIIRGEE